VGVSGTTAIVAIPSRRVPSAYVFTEQAAGDKSSSSRQGHNGLDGFGISVEYRCDRFVGARPPGGAGRCTCSQSPERLEAGAELKGSDTAGDEFGFR